MFVFTGHFFYLNLEFFLLTMGLLPTVPVVSGPIHVFGVTFFALLMLLCRLYHCRSSMYLHGNFNQVVLDYSGKGFKWDENF